MIPLNVKSIMQVLVDNGFEAYIVGGAVRDNLLGIEPKDFDVFTNATGQQILRIFPHGKVIGGPDRQKKILTVIVNGVEVSQYRSNGSRTDTGSSLIEHLNTCDFTINAIAMDVDENIIDPLNGKVDLGRKVIDFVGKPEDRIREDPLRIFRAIRFMSKYDFLVQSRSAIPMLQFHKYVTELPKERVKDELLKIIIYDKGFKYLDKYGMLEWIIPEWKECKNLEGGRFHNENLDEHLMLALDYARGLTNNPLLMLAVFLHDIGKPRSKEYVEGKGITFHGHEDVGAEYVVDWMTEYTFSIKEICYVQTIIAHHMIGKTGNLAVKSFTKVCNDLNESGVAIEDLVLQMYCDYQGNKLNPRMSYHEFLKESPYLKKYYEIKYSRQGFNVNDLEVTGHDIMKYGIEGPQIGQVKNRLFEEVCNGDIMNRRDRLLQRIPLIASELTPGMDI